jgi:hypothetical protein
MSNVGAKPPAVSNLVKSAEEKLGLVNDIPFGDQIKSRFQDLKEHAGVGHHVSAKDAKSNVGNLATAKQFFNDDAVAYWTELVPRLFTKFAPASNGQAADHALVAYGKGNNGQERTVSDGINDVPFDMAWAQVREAIGDDCTLNPREVTLLGNFLKQAAPILAASGDPDAHKAFEALADSLRSVLQSKVWNVPQRGSNLPNPADVVQDGINAVEAAFSKAANQAAWVPGASKTRQA